MTGGIGYVHGPLELPLLALHGSLAVDARNGRTPVLFPHNKSMGTLDDLEHWIAWRKNTLLDNGRRHALPVCSQSGRQEVCCSRLGAIWVGEDITLPNRLLSAFSSAPDSLPEPCWPNISLPTKHLCGQSCYYRRKPYQHKRLETRCWQIGINMHQNSSILSMY